MNIPRQKLLPFVIITVATIVAYANSMEGGFVLDDGNCIYQNPSIKNFGDSFFPPETVNIFRRQLVNVTLAINYAISGHDVWSYHLFNLIIHLVSALCLFSIISKILASKQIPNHYAQKADWIAMAAATLWAVHPLNTQAVTYIIQRCESMMGMLVLISMYLAIRSMNSKSPNIWLAGALTACVAGVWVKEAIFIAPILVIFYDRYFVSDSISHGIKSHRFLYAGYAVCITILALNLMGYTTSTQTSQKYSVFAYAISQPEVILHYLSLAVWPMNLVLDYQWPLSDISRALPYIAVVICMVAVSIWLALRKNVYGFFLGWFWITLAPSSSLFPINDLAFEQRMYLPLAGLAGAMAIGLSDISRLVKDKFKINTDYPIVGLWVVAVIGCTALTIERNEDYIKGELYMWQDVMRKRPENTKALSLIGKGLAQQGKYNEAFSYYEKALEIDPDGFALHNDLSIIFHTLGDNDKAEYHLRQMIRIAPEVPLPYLKLAQMMLSMRETAEATLLLEKAVELNPSLLPVRARLAQIYYQNGQWAKAIPHLEAYLAENPDNTNAQKMLNAIR